MMASFGALAMRRRNESILILECFRLDHENQRIKDERVESGMFTAVMLR